ncbi:MAG TPA: thioesterase family protein [Alphaproteobacteria bacterium]
MSSVADAQRRASYDFWTREKIRFGDVDRNDHVNNVVLAEYCENARVEFREAALPGSSTDPAFIWFVVSFSITYHAPLDYPGVAEIGTRAVELGRTSFTVGHGIFSGETPIATATSKIVCIDRATQRPRELPAPYRAALERLLQPGR